MVNEVEMTLPSDSQSSGVENGDKSSGSIKNGEKDIDELLTMGGPFSRFHILIQISMMLVFLTVSYNFLLTVFTADDPSWTCIGNSSKFCDQNYGKHIHSESEEFNQRCDLNRTEWKFVTDKGYSLVTEFDLVCDKTSVVAFASSSFYIGGLIGSVVSGMTADAYGRKPVLLCSLFITICSSIGCSYAATIWQYAGINIVLGAASVACYFTTFVYLIEFAPPRFRTVLGNLLILAFSFDMLLLDAAAYFERNWRKLQLYASLPCIIAFLVSCFVPESPRWLLAMGRKRCASNVFDKINKLNGSPGSVIQLKSPTVSEERKYSYVDLCRSGKIFILTLSIGVVWSSVATVSYSIMLNSPNLGGNMYKVFALSIIVDIPACIACSYLCDRFGRKISILGSLFISGILVGSMAVFPRSLSCKYILNISIMILARLINGIAFFGIFTWTCEIYPTVLRSQGIAVCAVFERVGLLTVPFITKVLYKVNYTLPYILMCGLAVLASIIGLILPETNKQPTREMYDDFFDVVLTDTYINHGIDNHLGQDTKEEKVCS